MDSKASRRLSRSLRRKLAWFSEASYGKDPTCRNHVLFWMIFILISWTISNPRIVMRHRYSFSPLPLLAWSLTIFSSSVLCGRNSSGRTVSTSTIPLRASPTFCVPSYLAIDHPSQWSSRIPQTRHESNEHVLSNTRRSALGWMWLPFGEHVCTQSFWRRCIGQP